MYADYTGTHGDTYNEYDVIEYGNTDSKDSPTEKTQSGDARDTAGYEGDESYDDYASAYTNTVQNT